MRQYIKCLVEGIVIWTIIGVVASIGIAIFTAHKAAGAYKFPNINEIVSMANQVGSRDKTLSLQTPNDLGSTSDTPDSLDIWLIKLAKCESGGDPKKIHYDDGVIGSHSYGLYQWKIDSFYRYNKIYKVLPDLEKQEVMNIIYDPQVQSKLTKKVIQGGGASNWFNCLKLIGRPPK